VRNLTRFIARYDPGALVHCLCFGHPHEHHEQRSRKSVYEFRPGQLFAIVRWRRDGEDRQHRSLAILEAASDREQWVPCVDLVPGVDPPPIVHAMVDQHGPAGQGGAVDALLDLIEDLKHRQQEPARLSAKFWRTTAHRILLGEPAVGHLEVTE